MFTMYSNLVYNISFPRAMSSSSWALIPKALSPRPVGRASGNATEFYPHMPYQAKDKIMLLIQKLEEKKKY